MTNVFKWSHMAEVVMYSLSRTHFIWLIVTYSFHYFQHWQKDKTIVYILFLTAGLHNGKVLDNVIRRCYFYRNMK